MFANPSVVEFASCYTAARSLYCIAALLCCSVRYVERGGGGGGGGRSLYCPELPSLRDSPFPSFCPPTPLKEEKRAQERLLGVLT